MSDPAAGPATPLAVVFDLDGTLVDSLDDLAAAVTRLQAELGVAPSSRDAIRLRVGHGARDLVARSIQGAAPLEEALARFFAIYAAGLVDRTRPYPGLVELLDRLGARGIVRAVATNKPARLVAPLLRALELDRRIEGWASGDEVPPKPDPAALRLALARAGLPSVDPARVAYVGDMAVDVATARRFGARAVAVGWGFDPDAARGAGPDLFVEDAAALGLALLGSGLPLPPRTPGRLKGRVDDAFSEPLPDEELEAWES